MLKFGKWCVCFVFATCMYAIPSASAQQSGSGQCSEQEMELLNGYDEVQSGNENEAAAAMNMISNLMSQVSPEAAAMMQLFQGMVSTISGLTDCRRTEVSTIKSDYESGQIDKEEAKVRLAVVQENVQEDNSKIEEIESASSDSESNEEIQVAKQDHEALEAEIDDLFRDLDA